MIVPGLAANRIRGVRSQPLTTCPTHLKKPPSPCNGGFGIKPWQCDLSALHFSLKSKYSHRHGRHCGFSGYLDEKDITALRKALKKAEYLGAGFDEMQMKYGTIENYFSDGPGIDAIGQ